MMYEMARMSVKDGLVMTLHPGVYRNHHPSTFERFGPDTGHDIPFATTYTEALRPLLADFGTAPGFHFIPFTIDETVFSRELAPLAGFYPAVYLGAPWWFLDAPDAMLRFRAAVTETAGFSRSSGFIDDTRAFCSIPARHDASRRVEASFLARLVAEHRISEKRARKIIVDIVDAAPSKSLQTMNETARPRLNRTNYKAGPKAPVRIVHLGLGAFHRAHQAWYTNEVDAAREWGIAAFTGRSPEAANILSRQDGLYTLIQRSGEGDTWQVIESIVEANDGANLARLDRVGGRQNHCHHHADGHRGRLLPERTGRPELPSRSGGVGLGNPAPQLEHRGNGHGCPGDAEHGGRAPRRRPGGPPQGRRRPDRLGQLR